VQKEGHTNPGSLLTVFRQKYSLPHQDSQAGIILPLICTCSP
jgi:hypothetical protein